MFVFGQVGTCYNANKNGAKRHRYNCKEWRKAVLCLHPFQYLFPPFYSFLSVNIPHAPWSTTPRLWSIQRSDSLNALCECAICDWFRLIVPQVTWILFHSSSIVTPFSIAKYKLERMVMRRYLATLVEAVAVGFNVMSPFRTGQSCYFGNVILDLRDEGCKLPNGGKSLAIAYLCNNLWWQ